MNDADLIKGVQDMHKGILNDAAALKVIGQAAGAILLEASPRARKGQPGRAKVRRQLLWQLEDALIRSGYDMERAHQRYREFQAEIDAKVKEATSK